MDTYGLLFGLLNAGLFGGELDGKTKGELKDTDVQRKVYRAAKTHDIAHLASYCLDKTGLSDGETEIGKRLVNEQFMAVYRYENQKYELDRICETLDREAIPYVLLKGAVIRELYPEAWMRTSCDIDLLVSPENVDRAKNALVDGLGYIDKGKNDHDCQLYSKTDVHLELHFKLIGDDPISDKSENVLKKAWEHTVAEPGREYGRRFDDAMLIYYHILHLAKHLKNGGCGIKPFLDLYYFKGKINMDGAAEALLEEGGMLKAYRGALDLANVYFGGEPHTEVTGALSDFVLEGGVYGNMENIVAMRRGGEKNYAFLYALSRIFLPYNKLKYRYPELTEKKWLFLPYQFRRWIDLVREGRTASSFNELRINGGTTKEQIDVATGIWRDLGL